jgi:hypothetical protein
MGRIDDVLNVAGHRLGTMEIESALAAHPRVAEAAVVGKPHEIKGESVFAYVVLKGKRPSRAEAPALTEELRAWVASQLSPIAKPDEIRLADNLPKTRSGKIMRRLLRSIARGEEITQDVSTLENPAILDQLRGAPPRRTAKPTKTKAKSPSTKPAGAGPERAVKRPAAASKTAARTKRAVPHKPATRKKAAARKKPATRKKSPARKKVAMRRVNKSSKRKPRAKK